MTRPLRLEFEGALYHVTSRGDRREPIFVTQGKGLKLWDEALQGQIYLGNEAFTKRMQKQIAVQPGIEMPHAQHRPVVRPLTDYFAKAAR